MPENVTTQMEHEREVRFAVVIYGGVSLAIYINGIMQELLRMVRSTALPLGQLQYSEKVYRKLACMVGLSDTDDPEEVDRSIKMHDEPGTGDPWTPRTKFVADIFAGTSAGGINAIFCAKALATGQSLDQLAKLWINVADIDKLLNDRRSIEIPLRLERPPASLLNAKWMYLQLLKALTDMDQKAPPGAAPVAGDLDVFLTATDLDGLPLPLALPHQSVREKRHRNVFHFMRRETGERDDFRQKPDFSDSNNPFFAFAARCTSAFPFAFEPMALCDIFPIIQKLDEYKRFAYCNEDTDVWQKFYLDYVGDETPGSTPFRFRSFGDGGYLDNKPFSFAIDTIADRSADMPVDRKLIYIEPSPEEIFEPTRKGPEDRPDAIENSLDALIALPRYETIREDLMRLLEWNKNVARLRRIIRDLRIPETEAGLAGYENTVAFAAYRRLRHSATIDGMTLRVVKGLKIDPASSLAAALRELIDNYLPPSSPPGVIAEFLAAYDFDYFTRAAQYLRRKLREGRDTGTDAKELAGIKRQIRNCKEDPLTNVLPTLTDSQKQELEDFDKNLSSLGNRVSRKKARRELAIQMLDEGWREGLHAADEALRAHFAQTFRREDLERLLANHGGVARFQAQDSVVFPITFGTNVGEFGEVDVSRISPDDVTPLEGVTDMPKYSKIRGDRFGAFGGFLDKRWRKHDILRGRLDGAERLITAILPGDAKDVVEIREKLIIEAQKEIAEDWKEHYAAL